MGRKLFPGLIAIAAAAVGCGPSAESKSVPAVIPPAVSSSQTTFPNSAADVGRSPDDPVPGRYQFVYSSSLDAKESEAAQGAMPFTEIQLERSMCAGTCPAYTVTFRSDGTAEYIGRMYVPNIGIHGGKIPVGTYGRLCWAIEKLRLAQGPRSFNANWTDDTSTIIRVKSRDSEATLVISDYGRQGPIELWTIHNVIDGIASSIAWTPVMR